MTRVGTCSRSFFTRSQQQRKRRPGVAMWVAALVALTSSPVFPNGAEFPVAARGIALRIVLDSEQSRVTEGCFRFEGRPGRLPSVDPGTTMSVLSIRGTGGAGGGTGSIILDPSRWAVRGEGLRYVYGDDSGSAGGVTKIVFSRRKLIIRAGGPSFFWEYRPGKAVSSLGIRLEIGDEVYGAFSKDPRVLRGGVSCKGTTG